MLDVWSISLGGWRMVRANQWIRLDGSRNILARLDHCHIDDFSSEIAHLRARMLNIDGTTDLRPLKQPEATWGASEDEPTEVVQGIGYAVVPRYIRS